MFNSRDHKKFARIFLFVFIVGAMIASTSGSQAIAQPGPGKQPDIGQLQNQIDALQSQLAAMKQKDDLEDGNRVRSVGSQRSTRLPEQRVAAELFIRLYDLSDLFAVSPHYPAVTPNDLSLPRPVFGTDGTSVGVVGQGGGGGFGGSGGTFNIPPTPVPALAPRPIVQEAASISLRSAQVSMDQLVDAIKQTVEPEMWGQNRDEARIQFLGNTLLITATETMHTQINDLLNLFREHWGRRRTISIQTFWIRAGAAAAAELLDAKTTETVGAGVVDPKKWEAFLDSARTEKRFKFSATMTGHNNQTLSAVSGQQRHLILDAEPFETTTASMWFEDPDDIAPFGDGADEDDDLNLFSRTRAIVGFRPIRQPFHNGATIQVTPLATRGGKFVILDLHAKLNELMAANPAVSKRTIFARSGKDQIAEVELDSSDFQSYRLSTTLRCPNEQIVLAGGMTYDPNAADANEAGDKKAGESPNLYLFVKTSVHTITEDVSDWTAEQKPVKK